jgi:sphingomyelin phosphodiesterase acid-like 3
VNSIVRFILTALAAVLLAVTPLGAAELPPSGRFLVMSDLHFNPMDDPSLLDRLAAAEPSEWPTILENAHNAALSSYGHDTNWPLFRSTLEAMQRWLPNPVLVMVPGDLLAHNYRNKFAAASDHSDAAFRGFVSKTVAFLAAELRQRFPDAPVLLTLGNNDEICGDYKLQPNGPFLADTLPVMHELLMVGADDAFDREWLARGNYAIRLNDAQLRVILVNTVLISRNYRNACGQGGDPGKEMLAWLEQQLETAKRADEKVWLLYHIPPGIDAYATIQAGGCGATPVPMWKDTYLDPFVTLMRRYAETIAASFAGHTHMDEFRLIGDAGAVVLTPAVSPIYDQNPSFAIYSYTQNNRVLDRTLYYLDLSAPQTDWAEEYSFDEAWNVPTLDLAHLQQVATTIDASAEARAKWLRYYRVSHLSPPMPDDVARAYTCAISNISSAAYARCRCP